MAEGSCRERGQYCDRIRYTSFVCVCVYDVWYVLYMFVCMCVGLRLICVCVCVCVCVCGGVCCLCVLLVSDSDRWPS